MEERTLARVGAVAAMAGAVVGLVFNVLHPRPDDIDSVLSELEMVQDSSIWLFDHYMLGIAIALGLLGGVAISRSYAEESARSWGRFALVAQIIGVAIGFLTISVDGMIMDKVTGEWAAAGGGTGTPEFVTAAAVANVSLGLFTALIGSLFGVTATLFGLAGLSSATYPRWLGVLVLAGGVLGFAAATIQFLGGISDLSATVLFLPASIAFTVWLFASGWYLWQRTSREPEVTRVPVP
ncbi:MAG: hypothetical protein M3273_02815 [Actinomycetota bacterium]|nr:hypothetical protein [Actinomycetota bacterium]